MPRPGCGLRLGPPRSAPRAGAAPCWPGRGYTCGHTLVGGVIAAGREGRDLVTDLTSLDKRKLTRRPHSWFVAGSGPEPTFSFPGSPMRTLDADAWRESELRGGRLPPPLGLEGHHSRPPSASSSPPVRPSVALGRSFSRVGGGAHLRAGHEAGSLGDRPRHATGTRSALQHPRRSRRSALPPAAPSAPGPRPLLIPPRGPNGVSRPLRGTRLSPGGKIQLCVSKEGSEVAYEKDACLGVALGSHEDTSLPIRGTTSGRNRTGHQQWGVAWCPLDAATRVSAARRPQ